VLDEMKLTKVRISDMRRDRDCLDEVLAETVTDRASLEHKVEQLKQRLMKDNATAEADLKSELE
jgi:BMFP domain-containing protein YqiC